VSANRAGKVFDAGEGFILSPSPNMVRAVDVALVSKNRLATLKDTIGYIEIGPDLAVEVDSPSDSFTYVARSPGRGLHRAHAWCSSSSLPCAPCTSTGKVPRLLAWAQTLRLVLETWLRIGGWA